MVLELRNNNNQMISSVVLPYFQIDNTIKRGYTAVVIPGTSHNYFLVLSTNLFSSLKHLNLKDNFQETRKWKPCTYELDH